MNKKKILIVLGFVFLMVGFVSAYWALTFTGSAIVNIESSSDISFTASLDEVTIDASDGEVSAVQSVTINNNNGESYYRAFTNSTITDVEDDCDNTGDITVTMSQTSGALGQGAALIIPTSGSNTVLVTTTAVSDACPQSVSTSLIIEPLP